MNATRTLFAAAVGLASLVAGAAPAADNYAVDPLHTSVSFKVEHMGISMVHGRFNNVSGKFTIDTDDAANSTFSFTAKVESIDTNQKKRDDHLRSPDFFDAKQFPLITFESKSVKAVDGGLEVTGDLTMHGVTKSIMIPLKGGKTVNFGGRRIGYTADFTVKRADFGVGNPKFGNMLGADVYVSIGMEAVAKK